MATTAMTTMQKAQIVQRSLSVLVSELAWEVHALPLEEEIVLVCGFQRESSAENVFEEKLWLGKDEAEIIRQVRVMHRRFIERLIPADFSPR